MIGQTYVGDVKIINSDAGTMQDKINLSLRSMAWMRRSIAKVGVFQACCGKKKIQLPTPPKGIKITGNDDLFVCFLGKGM